MELTELPVKTAIGEIKRLHNKREERIVHSGKNRGKHKGKELEQNRIIYHKTCLNCFSKFEGISSSKYCSESCKQKAKRFRAKKNIQLLKA